MTPTLSNRLRNEVWCIDPAHLTSYLDSVEASAGLVGKIDHQRAEAPYELVGSTAVVTVSGVLGKRLDFFERFMGGADYDDVASQLTYAEQDDTVEKVLMVVDSPGGSVTGTAELGARIKDSPKPVYAFTDTLMASAGYWIASQAKAVLATPSSRVGSIGAIILHQEQSGLFEKLGIKTTAVFKGKHKADFSPFKPLSKEEKEDLQGRVNQAHAIFKKAVQRARKVSSEVFESKLYNSTDAVNLGLVDGHVNSLEEALAVIG